MYENIAGDMATAEGGVGGTGDAMVFLKSGRPDQVAGLVSPPFGMKSGGRALLT
jgi:hypothetical protein